MRVVLAEHIHTHTLAHIEKRRTIVGNSINIVRKWKCELVLDFSLYDCYRIADCICFLYLSFSFACNCQCQPNMPSLSFGSILTANGNSLPFRFVCTVIKRQWETSLQIVYYLSARNSIIRTYDLPACLCVCVPWHK